MKVELRGNGDLLDICCKSINEFGHVLVDEDADILVLANYNKILKKEEWLQYKHGAINCHRGKIPQYRGSSVLNWQIINGEIQGGVAIMQVDEGIDTGDILGDGVYSILLSDTISQVRDKAHSCIAELLPRVLQRISKGDIKPLRQSESYVNLACYWHHRVERDSKINWRTMNALKAYNVIRASESPYKAYCYDDNHQTIYINKAKLIDEMFCGKPGRVVRHIDDGSIVIAQDRGLWIDINRPIGEHLW